jgi:hypothetical protein
VQSPGGLAQSASLWTKAIQFVLYRPQPSPRAEIVYMPEFGELCDCRIGFELLPRTWDNSAFENLQPSSSIGPSTYDIRRASANILLLHVHFHDAFFMRTRTPSQSDGSNSDARTKGSTHARKRRPLNLRRTHHEGAHTQIGEPSRPSHL